VAALESAQILPGDHGVRVLRCLRRDVDDGERDHELPRPDVRGLASTLNEVARRVHVRAGVLAERPELRVEAVWLVREEVLPLRLRTGEGRRSLAEDVREVLNLPRLSLAAPTGVRAPRKRGRDAGAGGSG
jgi:hypothetical protein